MVCPRNISVDTLHKGDTEDDDDDDVDDNNSNNNCKCFCGVYMSVRLSVHINHFKAYRSRDAPPV